MRDIIGEPVVIFGASVLAEAGDRAALPANTRRP
jgi:hypothetical protein